MEDQQEHSRLSASSSSRWLVCPGSLTLDEPDRKELINEMAKIGTVVHAIAEDCLVLNIDAEVFNNTIIDDIEITDEYLTWANCYVDYIMSYYTSKFKIGIEHRTNYSKYAEDGFGTMDAYIVDNVNKILHIFDLKCGRITVDAYQNSQLTLYALGVRDELKLKNYTYKLHIIQPRTYHYDTWEFDNKYLNDFAKMVTERAKLTTSSIRIPGEKQCQWCKNNPTCNELKIYMDDLIGNMFDNIEELPMNDILKIYNNKKLISTYLENIENYLLEKAMNGEKLDGLKLVISNPHRKYTEEAEEILDMYLGEKAYTQKLIGVTAATKLLDKKIIDTIVYKPKGVPKLASITDKRETIEDISLQFDVID